MASTRVLIVLALVALVMVGHQVEAARELRAVQDTVIAGCKTHGERIALSQLQAMPELHLQCLKLLRSQLLARSRLMLVLCAVKLENAVLTQTGNTCSALSAAAPDSQAFLATRCCHLLLLPLQAGTSPVAQHSLFLEGASARAQPVMTITS